MTIDRHYAAASVGGVPVQVEACDTTLDRGWAPYAQGSLTVIAQGLQAVLDPRKRVRVIVHLARRHSSALTVGEIATLRAGMTVADIATAHQEMTVAQIAAHFSTPWETPERPPERVSISGWLTGARRDHSAPDRWEIEWCGDEQRAITRLSLQRLWKPNATTLRGIIGEALAADGLGLLEPGPADAVVELDDDGEYPAWEIGTSLWDYLDPLIDAAGFRLYVSELGRWHLVLDGATTSVMTLQDATEVTDELSPDNGRFYDHAIITYEWETATGVERRAYDTYARGTVSGYTETIPTRPPATLNRARRIVERAWQRAGALQVECVADYTIRPGQTCHDPISGLTGVCDAITWTHETARMTLTLIDTI